MKKKLAIFIFALVCISSVYGADSLAGDVYAAETGDITQSVTIEPGQFDEYTDSDEALSVETSDEVFEIKDYKQFVYPDFTENYTRDNPIVQLVPRELFAHRGEYFYMGKEYGFYVNTRANTQYGNVSTVFVLNVCADTSLSDNDFAKIRIEPLFCYEFYYLTGQNNFEYKQEVYRNGELQPDQSPSDKTYLPVSSDKNDIVVAAKFCDAAKASTPSFTENTNYAVKDIVIGANLMNEYYPNYGDDDYNVNSDYGSFITSVETVFTASRNNGGGNAAEYIGATLGFILDVLPLSTALDVGVSFVEFTNNLAEIDDERETVVTNVKGQETYSPLSNEMFNSKQSQIDNYGQLIKTAYAGLLSTDDDPVLFRTAGTDVLEAKFKISHSADEAWQTRLMCSYAIEIVSLGAGGSVNDSAVFESRPATSAMLLRNVRDYVPLEMGSNRLYKLPFGKVFFEFTPQYTSEYLIAPNGRDDFAVGVMLNGAVVPVTEENGEFFVEMNEGETYNICIKTDDRFAMVDGTVNLDLRTYIDNVSVTMAPNSTRRVKLLSSENGIFHFTVSDGGLVGAVYEIPDPNYEFDVTDDTYRDFYVDSQKPMYVELKNTSGEERQIVLTKNQCAAPSENSLVSDPKRYYKFTAPETGYYLLAIDGPTHGMAFDFKDVNNGTFPAHLNYDFINRVTTYSFQMESGQTIYIGARSESGEDIVINMRVDRDTNLVEWVVDGQEVVDGRVTMKRNETIHPQVYINGVLVEAFQSNTNEITIADGMLTCRETLMCGETYYISPVGLVGGAEDDVNAVYRLTIVVEYDYNPELTIDSGENVTLTFGLTADVEQVTFILSNDSGSQVFTVDMLAAATPSQEGLFMTWDITDYFLSKFHRMATDITIRLDSMIIEYDLANQTPNQKTIFNGDDFSTQNITTPLLFGGGSGEADDPYLISCLRHLQNMEYNSFKNDENQEFIRGYYKLTVNLVLTGKWTPLGANYNYGFNGHFDGGNHTISNLKISMSNGAAQSFGLFSTTRGEIKNLTIIGDISVTNGSNSPTSVPSSCAAGMLSGVNHARLDNIIVEGSIEGRGYVCIGGIVGINYADISGALSEVTISGGYRLGGIAGVNENGTIDDGSFTGSINYEYNFYKNISGQDAIGGIVGLNSYGGEVRSGTFRGTITVTFRDCWDDPDFKPYIGGLVGWNKDSYVSGGITAGGSINTNNLNESVSYGFLGLQKANQKDNVGTRIGLND